MKLRNRNGFTLIELLVVIAIIAILAAILFPVFAQARDKARQATCLSNEKQLGLAAMQYVQDFDEQYPLGEVRYSYSWDDGGGNTYNYAYWTYAADVPPYADYEQYFWANAMQPYIRNLQVYACPSTLYSTYPGYENFSYTYNGLLHASSLAAVNMPAQLPVFWEGLGKSSLQGYAYSLPFLNCSTDPVCRYQPAVSGCNGESNWEGTGAASNLYSPYPTAYVHAQGENFLMADGHAKYRTLGPSGSDFYNWSYGGTDGQYLNDPKINPWAAYGSSGYAIYPNFDKYNCHPYQFRPDWDGN